MADVCEALIGAVAFHTTTLQAFRVTSYVVGIGKKDLDALLEAHMYGFVPYSIVKQLDENDPILFTPDAIKRVSILESIQEYSV